MINHSAKKEESALKTGQTINGEQNLPGTRGFTQQRRERDV